MSAGDLWDVEHLVCSSIRTQGLLVEAGVKGDQVRLSFVFLSHNLEGHRGARLQEGSNHI